MKLLLLLPAFFGRSGSGFLGATFKGCRCLELLSMNVSGLTYIVLEDRTGGSGGVQL